MFTVHCPTAAADVLLGPRAIRSLHPTGDGTLVYFRCSCGAHGIATTNRRDGTWRQLHHGPAVTTDAVIPAAAERAIA